MSILNRPYAGTWGMNRRSVVKHTPDALVYFNGDTSVAGCPSCYGTIDLQQYITSVSADPSTEGPATASISMLIPAHEGDTLVRDGQFVLRPGIEVHIYFRGYFPTQGILEGMPEEDTGGVDLSSSVMYPYYMVFHGVVTEVDYAFSGGEHTASLSCADMLHFWQYQNMITNIATQGSTPDNTKERPNLMGHRFAGMTPYSIIYTLFRDVNGAAGGIAFALQNETNNAAKSTATQESLYEMTTRYWERRFAESMTSLRMYGADGTLYNAFETAFLGTMTADPTRDIGKKFGNMEAQRLEFDPLTKRKANVIGFDPYTLYATDASNDAGLGVNVAQLQAFVADSSQLGTVELFETVYETKLDIANTVKEVTGFEFFQDVDGDIVFKPPFYNLDTSSSRVYRIAPVDIESFNTPQREPEATVVKATTNPFQNFKTGGGLEGEWGVRAEYIDHRLVAQYGWRHKTLGDSSYYVDKRSLFYACIAQMDVFNIGVNSATCTIPLRPELRPGYPVYIEHLDCFYYIQSMSHSFTFGGQCMTTLNLVGRRAKFFAPGKPPGDRKATIEDIDLSNPHLPKLPLEVVGNDGIPRLQGFPNVVMTLDPELVNPLTFYNGLNIEALDNENSIRTLVRTVLASRTNVLEVDPDNAIPGADAKSIYFDGPWRLKSGEGQYIPLGTTQSLLRDNQTLISAVRKLPGERRANQERVLRENAALPFVQLINTIQTLTEKAFPGSDATASYLELLSDYKAHYNPGSTLPGYYRYYSSSHPDVSQQGPLQIARTNSGQITTGGSSRITDLPFNKETLQFAKDGSNTLVPGVPEVGIPTLNSTSNPIVMPTHLLTSFNLAVFDIEYDGNRVATLGDKAVNFPVAALESAFTTNFVAQLEASGLSESTPLSDLEPFWNERAAFVQPRVQLTTIGVQPPPRPANTSSNIPAFQQALQEAVPNIPLTFTSGFRPPLKQAQLLVQKRRDEGDAVVRDRYANKRLIDEVLAVPNTANDMARVLEAQVQRGQYLSSHMKSDAFDVTTRGLSNAQIQEVLRAAVELGAEAFFENASQPHLHIEGISNYINNTPSSAVSGAYDVGDFDFPLDPSNTLGDEAGDGLDGQIQTVASQMGAALATAAADTLMAIKRGILSGTLSISDNGNQITTIEAAEPVLLQAWTSIWPEGSSVTTASNTKQRSRGTKKTYKHNVPIFPVSDERGYEVVGTFRYGRGMSIEAGGSFDVLSNRDVTTNTSFDIVEQFLASITANTDASIAVATLSPEKRAELASLVGGVDLTARDGQLRVVNPDGTLSGIGHSSRPANSNQTTQKLTVTNAAYGLADMQVLTDRNVCSCVGAEAATMLQAFASGNFVLVEDDAVNDWLRNQSVSQASAWKATQDAYRGTVQNPRSIRDEVDLALNRLNR